jgi:mono/diheme cytochrome c family protein
VSYRAVITSLLLAVLALSGCTGQPSKETPVVPLRNMYNQPRYDVQSRSTFFQDHRTMRPLVEGAVAVEMEPALPIQTGRTLDDSAWLAEVPAEVIARHGGMQQTVERGQERFGIYCAPCHGLSGDGNGVVAERAKALEANTLAPPSFHTDAIRHMPDGQMYSTITNGVRFMPVYRQSIPLDDRWAIVTYVRALQLSQASRTTAMNTEQNQ